MTRRLVKTCRMPHWAQAVVHHLGREGVVEIDRHAAVEGQSRVDHHAGDGRGQQYADLLLVAGQVRSGGASFGPRAFASAAPRR